MEGDKRVEEGKRWGLGFFFSSFSFLFFLFFLFFIGARWRVPGKA